MKKLILPLVFLATVFTACDKEDPIIPNEEELITTLIYRLEPLGVGDIVELKFQDLDGDGGDPPVISNPPLQANMTYQGSITLLNELVTPAEDITVEVEEENQEHQLFYVVDPLKIDIDYMDNDLDGNALGILTSLSTGGATTGDLTIVLRHEPTKPNDGTPEGAGGETDIAVTFSLTVQ